MIVYIIGTGHSGSTLLNLVLGSHSDIFSLGEIYHFPEYYHRNGVCTCGQSIKECRVWSKVGSLLNEDLDNSFTDNPLSLDLFPSIGRKWYEKALYITHKWARKKGLSSRQEKTLEKNKTITFEKVIDFYEIVKRVSGCSILVDSSKKPVRARAIFEYNSHHPQKFIHLIRDGRGFLYSKLKVYNNISLLEVSKRWLIVNLLAEGIAKSLPSDLYFKVKYENFCRYPESVIGNLCNFIGVPYEDTMLAFNKITHHNIGGNAMRFRGEGILKPDKEWCHALHKKDIRTFNLIAGWLNCLYGYR